MGTDPKGIGSLTRFEPMTIFVKTAEDLKGEAVSTVKFCNCQHPFEGSLSFDVVVDGVYPNGKYCIMLMQAAEVYNGIKLQAPTAYFSIPVANTEVAKVVVNAIGSYELCDKFRKDEPISVHLCWPYAPVVDWEIMANQVKLSESFAARLQQLQQQSIETDHRVSATIATAKELKTRLELIDIKYPEQ